VPAPPVADPKPAGGVKGWGGLRRALPDLIPQVAPADVSSGGGIAGAPVDPNRPSHVANLSPDASLRELLIEAFKIAEIRFKNFDKDDAGALMFREVKRDISNAGFYDEQKLVEIWRRCDIDKSDMIDFSEFLYMLYMWQYANEIGTSSTGVPGGYASAYVQAKKTDLYSAFFKFKTNREIVFKGFSKMENLYMQYDTDGNRKFSESELRTFMENHLPFVFRAAATQKLIRDFYPSNRPNHEIYFHEFLGLIYLCCVEYAPDRLQGTYKSQCMPSARADDRFSISNLRMAYRALEADFKSFDADGNGRLELHEVCEGIRTNMGADQKVNFFARLEFQFNMTDLDKTGDLDFYQFCLLAFHTCSDGSYTTLIINATNGRCCPSSYIHTPHRRCANSLPRILPGVLTYDILPMDSFCPCMYTRVLCVCSCTLACIGAHAQH
jgi:Ca2+-binding EF-hand superfamily protein